MLIDVKTNALLISEFLEQARDIIIADMDLNNRNATGKTKKSLRIISNEKGGALYGAEHIYYTFKGRGVGKLPPIQNIVEWCRAKGIPGTRAWAIAKYIAKNGTKLHRAGGSDALERATAKQRIDEFIKQITNNYIVQTRSSLLDVINK